MTFVQKLIGRTRSTMRKVAVILAATQLMLGTAPIIESDSRSTVAHVESGGVDTHYAHNDESCIACVAIKVFGSAELERAAVSSPVTLPAANAAAAGELDTRLINGPPRSRAPPAPLLG